MKETISFCLLLFIGTALVAQSRESADSAKSSLQMGAEYSIFNPDFYCASSSPFKCDGGPLMKGIGILADYDVRGRYGAEGEVRWLRWDGMGGQLETTYLIGPQYRLYQTHSLAFWAKFLIGVGSIRTDGYPGPDTLKGTMFVYAPNGSVDYGLNRKISLRADYELQKWPTFATLPPNTHGLTPNGFSAGILYSIFGR